MAGCHNSVRLNPIFKAFLEGVYDHKCALYKLNGLWDILKRIFEHVRNYWKESIEETVLVRKMTYDEGDLLSYLNLHMPVDFEQFPCLRDHSFSYFSSGQPKPIFPKQRNININMMPFILHNCFTECKLPKYLAKYWQNFISKCIFDETEFGRICYLTIHESKVKRKCTQQRPGIHTERLGRLDLRGGLVSGLDIGQGHSTIQHYRVYHHTLPLVLGSYDKDSFEIRGGIFMASNVADSCRVWDCQILNDSCIGHLGNIEHLRNLLPKSESMKPNCLYWITDRTPHEFLPLRESTYRQYFQLVTSHVSLWFEDHSTKNPLGVVPDPNITKIVKGSIFKRGEAYIASDDSK